MNMRASAEDMGHGRCDDIGEHAEGVVKSGDDDREGWQRMDHGGGHPSRWGEDERANSPLGEKPTWKWIGTRGEKGVDGGRKGDHEDH